MDKMFEKPRPVNQKPVNQKPANQGPVNQKPVSVPEKPNIIENFNLDEVLDSKKLKKMIMFHTVVTANPQ